MTYTQNYQTVLETQIIQSAVKDANAEEDIKDTRLVDLQL
jgi:hypothetical protein